MALFANLDLLKNHVFSLYVFRKFVRAMDFFKLGARPLGCVFEIMLDDFGAMGPVIKVLLLRVVVL